MTMLKSLLLSCLLSFALILPTAYATDKININTADAATLDKELAGIGPKRASAIIDFREKHGPFKTPHDITQVSGIGPKTYERNKDKITVGNPNPPATTTKQEVKPETIPAEEDTQEAELATPKEEATTETE